MNINTVDRSNKLFKSIWRLDESSSNHRHKWTVRRKQTSIYITGIVFRTIDSFLERGMK